MGDIKSFQFTVRSEVLDEAKAKAEREGYPSIQFVLRDFLRRYGRGEISL